MMEMVSVLSFKVWPLESPFGTTTTIVPVLDGHDLIDWITEYDAGTTSDCPAGMPD